MSNIPIRGRGPRGEPPAPKIPPIVQPSSRDEVHASAFNLEAIWNGLDLYNLIEELCELYRLNNEHPFHLELERIGRSGGVDQSPVVCGRGRGGHCLQMNNITLQ